MLQPSKKLEEKEKEQPLGEVQIICSVYASRCSAKIGLASHMRTHNRLTPVRDAAKGSLKIKVKSSSPTCYSASYIRRIRG